MNNFFKKLLISSFSLVFAVNASDAPMQTPPPGDEAPQLPTVREMYGLPLESEEDIENFRRNLIDNINHSDSLLKVNPEQALLLLQNTRDLETSLLTFLSLFNSGNSYMNLVNLGNLTSESRSCYNAFLADPAEKATNLMVAYQEFIANADYKRGMENYIDFYLMDPCGRLVIAAFLGANLNITPEIADAFKDNLTDLLSVNFSITSDDGHPAPDTNYSRLVYNMFDQINHYLTKHKQGKGKDHNRDSDMPTSGDPQMDLLSKLLTALLGRM